MNLDLYKNKKKAKKIAIQIYQLKKIIKIIVKNALQKTGAAILYSRQNNPYCYSYQNTALFSFFED